MSLVLLGRSCVNTLNRPVGCDRNCSPALSTALFRTRYASGCSQLLLQPLLCFGGEILHLVFAQVVLPVAMAKVQLMNWRRAAWRCQTSPSSSAPPENPPSNEAFWKFNPDKASQPRHLRRPDLDADTRRKLPRVCVNFAHTRRSYE